MLYIYDLILQIQRLNLTEEDFEYEHQRQMLKRKAAERETANRTDWWFSRKYGAKLYILTCSVPTCAFLSVLLILYSFRDLYV